MKKIFSLIWGILIVMNNLLPAQNAPVTIAPSIGNALTGQPVSVPVSVTNFVDIGYFSLSLSYQSSALTFLNATANPAFTGVIINSSTPGIISFTWSGTTGFTLPDNAPLLNITFTYLTGVSPLTWNTSGTACQYKKFAGGAFLVLNDSPKSSYYIGGVVAKQLAPVTYAPIITNAAPGTIYLPVTVKNFSGISSLYLMFSYDINILTYKNSFTVNPGLPGDFQVGTQTGPPGKKYLIISWFGNPASLADGSTLVTLKFNYSTAAGTGNHTPLTWYDCGPCCEYTDLTSTILYDSPTSNHYVNGLVTNQVSPVAWLPSTEDAVPASTVEVPLLVNGFSNIHALSLAFTFDPNILTFLPGLSVPNPDFGTSLQVNHIPSGPGGKHTLVVSWTGTPVTLPNGSIIVTLSFQYGSGTSPLQWITNADSCVFLDALNNPLYKNPVSQYFGNGFITSHLAPILKIEPTAGIPGQTVIMPVTSSNFNNIGKFKLTFSYDPGILQFQSGSPASKLGGDFSVTNPGPGQVIVEWTGPAISFSKGSVIFDITFNYLGGSSALQWYCTDDASILYEGTTLMPLYDEPVSAHYISDSAVPGKPLNLTVYPEGLYNGNNTLIKAQDESGDHFGENISDEITVELHSASDYPIISYRSLRTKLLTNGNAIPLVPSSFVNDYYITIKHRNSIETVSALPVSMSGSSVSYLFDNASKAFGSNMGQMIDGVWVIFCGDSNQDGIVDGSDLSEIGNLADSGTIGYIPEDLTGDGLVDGSDLSIAGNNSDMGIGAIVP